MREIIVNKVGELAGDCRELGNCGSQILKVRNHSSATFFSPQFRNQIGSLQYCGIVEVRTKIADAHLWCLGVGGCRCVQVRVGGAVCDWGMRK
jgi:hypothetical protein